MPDQVWFCEHETCRRAITVVAGMRPPSRCPRCGRETRWQTEAPPTIFNMAVSENDKKFLRGIRAAWLDGE